MGTVDLTMALVMGLTGSLHCAGMCGPIVWVMPFGAFKGFKKWIGILLYHSGRITVYAAMGLILHSFQSFFSPQIQQYVSIILGALLLLVGIASFIPSKTLGSFKLPWSAWVMKQLSCHIGSPSLSTLLVIGMFNGLLPCGLVYMALAMAVTADHASQSVILMYAFGLATMPVLIGLTMLKTKLSFLRAAGIRRFVPLVMFFFGCLFILRGMNLGIPYLSPQVSINEQVVKTNCCHKPE